MKISNNASITDLKEILYRYKEEEVNHFGLEYAFPFLVQLLAKKNLTMKLIYQNNIRNFSYIHYFDNKNLLFYILDF